MSPQSSLLLAALVAVLGLLVLAFVPVSETEGARLRGVVVEDAGSRSVVLANVTLIARDVRKGDVVDIAVFWGGDAFVAVPE